MNEQQRSVAVITGGASGIGLALARLAVDRVDTVVVADVDEAALDAAVDELGGGPAVVGHIVDLRDPRQVDGLAATCAQLGVISLACLNAGVCSTGPDAWNTPIETLRFLLDVNVVGTANSISSLVPILIDQPASSSVVITGSMAGMVASANAAAYAASKAGTVAMAKALRAELAVAAPHVGVALCCPGMVQTNLMRTSARSNPDLMPDEVVQSSHGALNEFGLPADEQARLILDAVDAGRFWVLPPAGDPFAAALGQELAEQREGIDA